MTLSRTRLPVLESRIAVYEDAEQRPAEWGRESLPQLVDTAGRTYRYLRLSVTDRCDLACVYCMPPSGEEEHALRKELLTFEELARVVRVLSRMGIRRVRFTGGEPLVRKDFVRLVQLVSETTDVKQLALTTNAMRLAPLAKPLHDAGLRAVNVSLDSLDPERFARLTRGGDLERVIAGIDAALTLGWTVKLNVVALRGETDEEAADIVDWAWARGITPRFIELMPLGEGALLDPSMRVEASEIQQRLGSRIGLATDSEADRGPATYLEKDGKRVGFITPLSHEFCATCNRVRVTAQGDIRACLASRRALSLRDCMRSGGDDRDLGWMLWTAVRGKAAGHAFLDPDETEHTRVGMSLIGG